MSGFWTLFLTYLGVPCAISAIRPISSDREPHDPVRHLLAMPDSGGVRLSTELTRGDGARIAATDFDWWFATQPQRAAR